MSPDFDPAAAYSRYSRQILFNGIGSDGQARITSSRVAQIGCGALGTVQASLLVRALLPKAIAAEKKLRAVVG